MNRKLTGNHYHQYINPHRAIDQGAIEVHGITSEFLADKPEFETISAAFIEFVQGAELIIHNAPFDLGFLDSELQRLSPSKGSVMAFWVRQRSEWPVSHGTDCSAVRQPRITTCY